MRKKRNEKFYLLLGALVLVLALTACGGGGGGNKPTPTTGTINGKILNFDGTSPINGATVTIEGTSLTARSNDDGTYSIANVPAGNGKKVTAVKIDEDTKDDLYYKNSVTVNLQSGQTLSNQNINLTSAVTSEKADTYTISGTISFEE